jgi:ribonucleoside-diphosphate reductase alpha chain
VALAKASWDEALSLGEQHGYRNAQATVIAPTGTIGLVMDCDTTGIEPDFALVKFKKLAGGGYFKIINQSVPAALESSATAPPRSRRSWPTPSATARSRTRPRSTRARSPRHGFGPAQLEKIEAALPQAFDIRFVFNQWTLGEEFCTGTSSASRRRS